MSARSLVTVGDMAPGSRYTLTRDDDVEYTVISHGPLGNRSRVLGPDGSHIYVSTDVSRYFVGKAAAEPPPFEPVRVGEIRAFEFWVSDEGAWSIWVDQVAATADEYGAWFVVGSAPNGDMLAIDTLRKHDELRELIRSNNLRSFTFWRFPS